VAVVEELFEEKLISRIHPDPRSASDGIGPGRQPMPKREKDFLKIREDYPELRREGTRSKSSFLESSNPF